MKYTTLGSSGIHVSQLCVGCMSFGGIFGPTTEAESFACLDAAIDHGIDFLDTANIYGMGVSAGTYSSVFIACVVLVWLKLTREDLIPPVEADAADERP
mgnify:CR=1 FL=1